MALSEYEKQVLAEMEKELRKQDPALADTMATSLPKEEPAPEALPAKPPLSPRRIAIGSILVALGLATVLAGVTFSIPVWTVILGALGFVMMVGGVLYALSTGKDAETEKSANRAAPTKPGLTKREKEEQRRRRWENRGM